MTPKTPKPPLTVKNRKQCNRCFEMFPKEGPATRICQPCRKKAIIRAADTRREYYRLKRLNQPNTYITDFIRFTKA